MECTADLLTCFLGGFVAPLAFFFVGYLARQLKKYFLDAANIKVE